MKSLKNSSGFLKVMIVRLYSSSVSKLSCSKMDLSSGERT